MENNESLLREWIDKAEAYCARAEHCAADVRRKMVQWNVESDYTDRIIEALYERGFLDDDRYCEAYVHDKVAYQKWGRLKIQAGLRALQLPNGVISKALDNIEENIYMDNLRTLTHQRRADCEEKRLRFLLQRGFTYDEIKRAAKD